MSEPTLNFSVTCPACALESVCEIPIAEIASGLLCGRSFRLHSHCHNRHWTASFTEREHLRKSLAHLNSDKQNRPHPEELAFTP